MGRSSNKAPIAQVFIAGPGYRGGGLTVSVSAMLDTGSSRSFIPLSIARQLDLPDGKSAVRIGTMSGGGTKRPFKGTLIYPDKRSIRACTLLASDNGHWSGDVQMILGMDLLGARCVHRGHRAGSVGLAGRVANDAMRR